MRLPGLAIIMAAAIAASFGAAAADDAAPRGDRVCFSTTDTRENILAHKLADPFALLRAQAAEHRAEAISVKLCRIGGAFVYEIDLLRRDGRLIHTRVDARSGRPAVVEGGR